MRPCELKHSEAARGHEALADRGFLVRMNERGSDARPFGSRLGLSRSDQGAALR